MPIRILILAIALAAFIAPASAQSTTQSTSQSTSSPNAIQPCEATPATPKPGGAGAPVKVGVRSSQTVIDASIPDDPDVEKMLAPYSGRVRALSAVIGKLDGTLEKGNVGAGTLGNFVTDGIRSFAQTKLNKPIALVIMNAGGLRKNQIAPGELRATDIFELLPFENVLVAVDISGADLLKLLPAVVRDAQSGARIQYKWNDQDKPEFLSGKLIGENRQDQEIDPNKTYTVVTLDYLLKVSGGAYAILKEAKSVAPPLNVTLRDAVMEYVKAETAAGRMIRAHVDDRYVQVGPGPKGKPEEPR